MSKEMMHRLFYQGACLIQLAVVMLPVAGNAASFTPLGTLGGQGTPTSAARAVSADGRVVVGQSYGPSGSEAFRWTLESGMVGLGDLPGNQYYSDAMGVSADGSVIVGSSSSAATYSNGGVEAFRWTSGEGMVGLGFLPGEGYDPFRSNAHGVSGDGTVIVGSSYTSYGYQPFRWTAAGGMVSLGDLPGGFLLDGGAYGVSADGSVVVGDSVSDIGREAFRWSSSGGMEGLGLLPGGGSTDYGRAASADGSVVVGGGNGGAWIWSVDGGLVPFRDLPGGNLTSVASGISGDGRIVVGLGDGGSGLEAFLWSESLGVQNLMQYLVANGATGLANWRLFNAAAISTDGSTVVGMGINPDGIAEAYVANLAPVPVPAAVWSFGSAIGVLAWLRRKRE